MIKEYENTQEYMNFVSDRHEFECHCCHKDIENEACEEVKKRISENKRLFQYEAFICPECITDKRCRSLGNRPHPHTESGRKWVFESVKESKEYLNPGSTDNFPNFEDWNKPA